jgi:hypothetical protein
VAPSSYFEVETGLRRGVVVASPMGGQQRSTFTEYRAFDGTKVATRHVQSTMQGDVVIVLSDVSFAPIDPTTFALPASIR